MTSILRRSLIILAVLLLVTPAALFAQSETASEIIDLIFSDDESKITISETIETNARVAFTHDGQDYVIRVPVTIAVDETLPLLDNVSSTTSAARVGVFAIEVTGIDETEDEITVGYFDYAPSEGNKLVGVFFTLTNISQSPHRFAQWSSDGVVVGIDDLGQRYDTAELLGCEEVNPGSKVECLALFDVKLDVTLSSMDIQAIDQLTVTLEEASNE